MQGVSEKSVLRLFSITVIMLKNDPLRYNPHTCVGVDQTFLSKMPFNLQNFFGNGTKHIFEYILIAFSSTKRRFILLNIIQYPLNGELSLKHFTLKCRFSLQNVLKIQSVPFSKDFQKKGKICLLMIFQKISILSVKCAIYSILSYKT